MIERTDRITDHQKLKGHIVNNPFLNLHSVFLYIMKTPHIKNIQMHELSLGLFQMLMRFIRFNSTYMSLNGQSDSHSSYMSGFVM